MKREEHLAQEGRLVHIGQEVGDEVARIGVTSVGGVVWVGITRGRLGVVKDDNFVYGENGESASDAACYDRLQFGRCQTREQSL